MKAVKELIFILIAITAIILVVNINQYLAKAEERGLSPYVKCKVEKRKLSPHANPLWYYTLQEVKDYYKIHYNRKERLERYVYQKDGKYIGSIKRTDEGISTFEVPGNFIQSILSHMQQGLEKGWFKFIFWIDLNHGHPFLPVKIAKEVTSKYAAGVEFILNVIQHKDLGILYHSAEHFDPRDPTTNGYVYTRNIIGWFDGERPLEVVQPGPDATESERRGHSITQPKGYATCWWVGISAHHKGEFAIVVNNEVIRLDISFYVYDIYDGVKYKHKTSHVDVNTVP